MTQDHDRHTAHEGGSQGGGDQPPHVVVSLRAEVLRGNDTRAHRQTDKEVDDEVDERTAGADGGHGGISRELPHHRHVGGVEEELDLRICNSLKIL